jgi:hypothetical protein
MPASIHHGAAARNLPDKTLTLRLHDPGLGARLRA